MVTVSTLVNNSVNNHMSYGAAVSDNKKSKIDLNFQAHDSKKTKNKEGRPKADCLVENTFVNKMKINWDKTTAIPFVHFPRGLGGAPDYTFFEFLQTAKFPYYVGGPILAALFYAGVKKDNMIAGNAAKNVAKHMALGVGLYYLGAAVAKSIISNTVKAARGIDLNQPYVRVIPTSTNQTGVFKKDIEYHKLFESVDFTYWPLLYKKGNTPKEINENYAKIAKKYGIDEDANDVDSTVKPLIKKTVVMARAWQYALTAFYVTLGIGMANQPAWEKSSPDGFKKTVTEGIFGKNVRFMDRLHNTKVMLYNYMIKPFGKSFVEFWKGHNKASSIAGKSVILSSAAATLMALGLLLGSTSGRRHKIENSGTNKIKGEVKKNG